MEIPELMQRYRLNSRQSLYARLKSLGLVLEKGNRNKVYATSEQVELLDELDEHLKNGGSLKSFLPTTKTVPFSDISEDLLPSSQVVGEGEVDLAKRRRSEGLVDRQAGIHQLRIITGILQAQLAVNRLSEGDLFFIKSQCQFQHGRFAH